MCMLGNRTLESGSTLNRKIHDLIILLGDEGQRMREDLRPTPHRRRGARSRNPETTT